MDSRHKIISGVAGGVAVLGIALGGSALASGGTTSAAASGGTEHAANGGSGQPGMPGRHAANRGSGQSGMPGMPGELEQGRPDNDHFGGGHDGPRRGRGPGGFGPSGEETLTGDALATVSVAVLAKLPGATVVRAESNGAGGGYHVVAQKADGSAALVLLDADFAVVQVLTRGPMDAGRNTV